jgi:hypothetical protein
MLKRESRGGGPLIAGFWPPGPTAAGQIFVSTGPGIGVWGSRTLSGTRAQRLAYTSAAAELGAFWIETDTLEVWCLTVIGAPGVCHWKEVVLVEGTETAADVNLDVDPPIAVLPVTLAGLGLSRVYAATVGFHVTLYTVASNQVNGALDCVAQIRIVTNGAGVATVLVVALEPPTSRLPVALAGATISLITSVSGFTIWAQRPVGVACWARAEWHCERFNDVGPV